MCWPGEEGCWALCVGPVKKVVGLCVLAQWQGFVCWPSEGCCRSLCVGPVKEVVGLCVLAQ